MCKPKPPPVEDKSGCNENEEEDGSNERDTNVNQYHSQREEHRRVIWPEGRCCFNKLLQRTYYMMLKDSSLAAIYLYDPVLGFKDFKIFLELLLLSMEAVSSLMVAAVKLPMLNPGEFELWKMRIEQYFLMTDYALWEVIVNGDSPPPKITVDGVEQTYPPTTVEEKLAQKNELKARGLELEILGETISQEDMNLKFLRSLPSEWKTHTLIWRNKPNLDTLSMNDLYNNLKIYETEVKGSSSSNQNSQNVAFVSSNNSVSSNQAYGSNSANADNMSNIIYADDLEEMDLKWQMAMLTIRARIFLNKIGKKINANGSETTRFNKSKVECYNCHKKGHFARECKALRENRNREPVRRNVTVETTETKALVAQDGLGMTGVIRLKKDLQTLHLWHIHLQSQLNVGACKAGLESVEARLDMYKKNEVVFEKDIKILKLDIKLRDNALIELRKKFEKAEKERDDLKLTLEKFRNSSKNLSKLLKIQVSDKFKTGVGFDRQVVDSHVFDSQENDSESVTSIPDVRTSEAKTSVSKPKSVGEPLIEDWICDSEDENENEFKSKQRKPSFAKIEFVKSNEHAKTTRESVKK
ncbi:ribonuclease H-like domain-containing protein [Tanacetum coccineum]